MRLAPSVLGMKALSRTCHGMSPHWTVHLATECGGGDVNKSVKIVKIVVFIPTGAVVYVLDLASWACCMRRILRIW
jgi:hypothetical protein